MPDPKATQIDQRQRKRFGTAMRDSAGQIAPGEPGLRQNVNNATLQPMSQDNRMSEEKWRSIFPKPAAPAQPSPQAGVSTVPPPPKTPPVATPQQANAARFGAAAAVNPMAPGVAVVPSFKPVPPPPAPAIVTHDAMQAYHDPRYTFRYPATVQSQVTSTGRSAPNVRGERNIVVPGNPNQPGGGLAREVNAAEDRMQTFIPKGDALLPKNAAGGMIVDKRYRPANGDAVGYVTTGPRTVTGPVAFDENGAVDVSRSFDIVKAREMAKTRSPKAVAASAQMKEMVRKGTVPDPGLPPAAGKARPMSGTTRNLEFSYPGWSRMTPDERVAAVMAGRGSAAAPVASLEDRYAPPRPMAYNPKKKPTPDFGAREAQAKAASAQPAAQPAKAPRVTQDQVQNTMSKVSNLPLMDGVRQLGGPLGAAADTALRTPAVHSVVTDVINSATMPKQTLRPQPDLRQAATEGLNNLVTGAQNYAGTLPKQTVRQGGDVAAIQAAKGKAAGFLSKVKDAILPPGNAIPRSQPQVAKAPAPSEPATSYPSPSVTGRGAIVPPPAGSVDLPTIPGPKTKAKIQEIRNRNAAKPGFFEDNGPAHRAFNAVGLAKYQPSPQDVAKGLEKFKPPMPVPQPEMSALAKAQAANPNDLFLNPPGYNPVDRVLAKYAPMPKKKATPVRKAANGSQAQVRYAGSAY